MVYKSTKDLKAQARVVMIGRMGTAVGSMILYMIFVLIISELTSFSLPENKAAALIFSILVNFVVAVIVGILQIGLKSIYLDMQFGNEAGIFSLFRYYRENQNSAVVISAFFALLDTVCSLPVLAVLIFQETQSVLTLPLVLVLLVRTVPPFLVRTLFFPVQYLLMDYPEMLPAAMIRTGQRLMRGRRMDYVKLSLSFIPMHLLGFMSMGIGTFWVLAYQNCTYAAFYKDMITARTKHKKASAAAEPAPEKTREPLDPQGIYPPPGKAYPEDSTEEDIPSEEDASGYTSQDTDM
jgi:uncharacterized membrane protein